MRWTPATNRKEVQNMTYQEIEKLVAGKELPCGGTNAEGEMVIIEAGRNEGVRFFHLTTAQNNNWVRHNYIYENGDREELFERHRHSSIQSQKATVLF